MSDATLPAEAAWPWWWSADEERYHGPCASRASAIMEAWSDDQMGTIHVCQATQDGLRTSLFDYDRISELFDEANEDMGDPDGDPISEDVKPAEWKKLADSLNHRVEVFIRQQGLKSWAFGKMVNQEAVDLSPGCLLSLPAEARTIVADLATGWASPTGYAREYLAERLDALREALRPPSENDTGSSAPGERASGQTPDGNETFKGPTS